MKEARTNNGKFILAYLVYVVSVGEQIVRLQIIEVTVGVRINLNESCEVAKAN